MFKPCEFARKKLNRTPETEGVRKYSNLKQFQNNIRIFILIKYKDFKFKVTITVNAKCNG